MAATHSAKLPLGTPAPPFALPDFDGKLVKLSDFSAAKALAVVFACNHCPLVVHVKDELPRIWQDYNDQGLALVAICSNDVDEYPEDSPENMREKAAEWGWRFPYLVDETQEVAKAYHATCTPDTFLFDADRKLVYRGQIDSSRPSNGLPVTGADLRHAIDAVLNGERPDEDQKPSIGCSIKWKPGNAPDYALGNF